MGKSEEKLIYRIKAQTKDNKITITAQTHNDALHKEAINIVEKEVLTSKPLGEHYSNFIVEPICTKEEWKEGIISFCPRCGANIREYGIEKGGDFDCIECGAYIEAHILSAGEE